MKWVGVTSFLGRIESAALKIGPMAEGSSVDIAKQVLELSQERVPVRTGVLKASGRVLPARRRGNKTKVRVGYGGEASRYAWIQHERLDYHHTIGEAKYLESAVMDVARSRSMVRTWDIHAKDLFS